MSPKTNSFWSGGGSVYLDGLLEEENKALTPLLEKLRTEADPQTKKNLEGQIESIKAEYKQKRKQAKYSLFGKS